MIAGMPLGSIIIGVVLHLCHCHIIVIVVSLSRLRVPRYGAILEFLNFAFLLVAFVLCLSCKCLLLLSLIALTNFISDKDLDAPHPFEILFIIFAVAFALEEYTASRQHGWISEYRYHDTLSSCINQVSSLHCKREDRTIPSLNIRPHDRIHLDVEYL